MDALANTEEIEIFELESVKDMLDFKWEKFAKRTHMIGFYFHTTYIFFLLCYIDDIYIHRDVSNLVNQQPNQKLLAIIFICVFYPLLYDGNQAV